jgi:hypothetical protein
LQLAIDGLIDRGMVEEFAPRRPVLIWPALWERPAGTFKLLKRMVRSSRTLDRQTLELFELLSDRPSANRVRSGQGSVTAKAAAEARSLAVVQATLAAILKAHPDAIWGTGSLWSISPFLVYAAGQRFAGSPASLPALRPDGTAHPAVRITQRIVDGVAWIAGDAPDQPSLLIEYEGASRNRLSTEHLLTAMAQSTLWGKPLVLVFVVGTEARRAVIDHCRGLLGSPELRSQEIGFPNASVAVRVVAASAATKNSALLCPPLWAADFLIRNGRGHHLVLTTD